MPVCTVEGCGKTAASIVGSHGGLCGMHRMRMMRHGHLEQTRPKGWGQGQGHPLYERWKSMMRGGRLSGGTAERWRVFLNFVEDVGEAPTPRHKLFRLDEALPYGPQNFEWRARVTDARVDSKSQESRNAYQRAFNAENPHVLKNFYLKRHYGITYAQYQAMFEAQNGTCAICHRRETRIYKKTGQPMMLAVDHCHKTGKNRQLLCSFCNHGLGNFDDDVAVLRAAIAYLERHAVSPLDIGPAPG